MSAPTNSRASHAHDHPDLRTDNPLYERTGSARAPFNAQRTDDDPARAARRESFMVKRQQPVPVLRPSPALALGPDAAAFDAQWNAERRDAREFHHTIASEERNHSMNNEDPIDPQAEKNAPRDILRDGNLKASLWSNEGEKGPFYSATLARTYRDGDGQLHDTHSFAGAELLRVSELARKAYDRTRELRREDHPSAPKPEPQPQNFVSQQQRPIAPPQPAQEVARPQPTPCAPTPDAAREARRDAFMEQRQQSQPAPVRQPDQQR